MRPLQKTPLPTPPSSWQRYCATSTAGAGAIYVTLLAIRKFPKDLWRVPLTTATLSSLVTYVTWRALRPRPVIKIRLVPIRLDPSSSQPLEETVLSFDNLLVTLDSEPPVTTLPTVASPPATLLATSPAPANTFSTPPSPEYVEPNVPASAAVRVQADSNHFSNRSHPLTATLESNMSETENASNQSTITENTTSGIGQEQPQADLDVETNTELNPNEQPVPSVSPPPLPRDTSSNPPPPATPSYLPYQREVSTVPTVHSPATPTLARGFSPGGAFVAIQLPTAHNPTPYKGPAPLLPFVAPQQTPASLDQFLYGIQPTGKSSSWWQRLTGGKTTGDATLKNGQTDLMEKPHTYTAASGTYRLVAKESCYYTLIYQGADERTEYPIQKTKNGWRYHNPITSVWRASSEKVYPSVKELLAKRLGHKDSVFDMV